MLVFNNQQRDGYDEIASYGPEFYKEIKEMDAIYQFAGLTIDQMAQSLEAFMSNQFIKEMNELSISRMEKFLFIIGTQNKTLEERRTLVQASWISSGKLSKTKISEIVNTFAECSCDVKLANSNIEILMTFKDNPASYIGYIRKILNKAIPAHLGIVYVGTIDTALVFVWHSATDMQIENYFEVREYLKSIVEMMQIEMKIKNKEKIDINLITKKNEWYLDGIYLLDGTKLLDAYVKTEGL